ncbi:MAG: hypothetical protein Fur0012_03690 [Elusimicrobiota bacterium]
MNSKKTLYISLAVMALVVIVYNLLMRGYFTDSGEEIYQNQETEEQTFLNKMRQKQEDLKNQRPMPQAQTEKRETFETDSIKLIKDKNFSEVAEKPKSPMQRLIEMAQGKDRNPIYLSEQDLNKKINLYDRVSSEEKLRPSEVPPPGEEPKTRISRISAPVTYKVFHDENSWKEFLKDHKVRGIKADFSKNDVLILVSNSDLPNGIFLVDSFKSEKGIATVYYRVNPLEMSSSSESKAQNHYSAINIPKRSEVKLEQID